MAYGTVVSTVAIHVPEQKNIKIKQKHKNGTKLVSKISAINISKQGGNCSNTM